MKFRNTQTEGARTGYDVFSGPSANCTTWQAGGKVRPAMSENREVGVHEVTSKYSLTDVTWARIAQPFLFHSNIITNA